MIAMNTTAALLVNAEPLSRGNGKGADVVNNVKTANPIIAHKPVSTTDGKTCQPAKAARTAKKPAAPRKKRYDEEDLIAFGENAIMLRGAAKAILDMFHALSYADDDQKEVVNGVKEAFEEAAFLHRLCDRGSCKGVRCRREALSGGLAVRPKDQGEEE